MRSAILLLCAAACLYGDSFKPAEVTIVGDIDYGKTSDPIECSGPPRYRALVFNGSSGDRIELTLRGGDRKAFVALADDRLTRLASGVGHLAFTLPEKGPDAQAYYIVFRDSEDQSATFTVELKRIDRARLASMPHPAL